jgi:hypothetical protein
MTCVAQQFRAPLPLLLTLLRGREWLAYGLTKKHREDIYSHRREAEWLNMQLGKLYEGGGVPDLEYSWLRIDLIDQYLLVLWQAPLFAANTRLPPL